MRNRSDTPAAGTPEPTVPLSRTAVLRLVALARPHRRLLIAAGLLSLVSTGVSLSLPLIARAALDKVLVTKQVALLDRAALAMLGLIVLSSLIGLTQYLMVAYAGNRVVLEMRERLFAHLQRLPVSFFDRTRSGDLASHLSNDVSLLQQTLTDDLVKLASQIVTLIGGIILAVAIDWRLTGVVVGLLALVLGGIIAMGVHVRRLTRQSLDALSDTMGAMTEALANIRLVKAFAREAHEDSRAGEKLQKVFKLSMRSSAFEGGLGTVAGLGFFFVLLGVTWYGGRSVMTGHLSGGSLLAFLMTVMIISGPMASLASLYSRLQRAVGAADRLFEILDESQEIPDIPNAQTFPDGAGEIVFSNVDFFYNSDTPVLRGLSLRIPAGRITAVVGASGAGKTTLASLLYRFYEPQGGSITIDGVSISSIQRRELREHVGLVPQEPVLFNGSLRDNIRYGKLTATDAEVEAAALAANVAEFVSQFPEGYETTVGERGITLSGGQRQRVAIARAVLKDPRILVLDEATSALDTRSEALVREALERLMRGRTTIVIAHRLTTIRNADQIAVLEAGQVVETGSHDDLLRLEGRYANLQGYDTVPAVSSH